MEITYQIDRKALKAAKFQEATVTKSDTEKNPDLVKICAVLELLS